jgi:hydroxymethylpyrimidine pyrophosphatase-like HAD family hydrolase
LEDTVGIGDSVMDVEFVRECGVSVAVSNADDELKSVADIITEKGSGYGFAELARIILESRNLDFGGA